MKKTTFLLLLLFIEVISFGQSSYDLPKIIPASPTAQTFMRYGEIPVDYSTGVPSIEIPIFTVEGRQLKVPISISYHASGIKVNDISSEVGLGWALNAGGMVSRSINGNRDEGSNIRTFFTAEQLLDSLNEVANIWSSTESCLTGIRSFEYFLNENFTNGEDPMSDRYFYKLPNGPSGIFTYSYYDLNEDSAITLPYRPLKIEKQVEYTGVGGWFKIVKFKITDENGTTYTFQTYLANPTRDHSEWFLKEMISADGTDTIAFNYIEQTVNSSIPIESHVYLGPPEVTTTNCYPENLYSSLSESISQSPVFNTPVLESIVSSKAIVRFEYADRNDFDDLKRLTRITIAPASSPADTIKRVRFIPKYFGTTDANRRLGLDSVIIDAPGDSHPQVYAFTYESQVLPPYPIKMEYPTYSFPTYSEDFWGYYNGNTSISPVPADFITNNYDKAYYGGSREAGAYSYSKACMLKEIKYPTGGRTVFEFERYISSTAYPYKTDPYAREGYIGGFRVASITNYNDSNEVANIKSYEYELPVTRQMNMAYFNYDQFFIEKKNIPGDPGGGIPDTWCWSVYAKETVFSNPVLPLDAAPGMPVMYQKVIEYNGTPTDNTGKTVYEYYPPYSPCDYINNPDHPLEFEAPQYYHTYHYDKGDYVPELIAKTVYAFSDSNYHRVSKQEYVYSPLFASQFTTGIKLSRTRRFPSIDYWCYNCPFDPITCASLAYDLIMEYLGSVIAIDTKAYQEASLLTNTKSYVYDPLDSTKYVLTSTDYTYNESNLAVHEMTTLSSKADTLRTLNKYPIDFPGTAVYDTMVKRNIITPAIERFSYKNSDFLQSTKTNYDFWNGTAWSTSGKVQALPRTLATKNMDEGDYETRLRYHIYDTVGNLLSVSKENDQPVLYMWDYKLNYPVAEVTNASLADIFYTSFEADGKGGWEFTGSGIVYPSALTGSRAYRPTAGSSSSSIYKSGLSSGITYIISFWKRDSAGTIGVSGATGGATGTIKNGWELYTYELSGHTTVSISGSGYIDELRLYPKGAKMTTYTYRPLVGMTSQSDPNNRIIFYDYDAFGRLSLVRDQDGKIVRKICYSYDGQVEDCGIFGNTVISANYTSQVCGSQTTALPYFVNVPAGMFTSNISLQDANTQAQQYAQEQADLYGTCQPDIAINYTNYYGATCYIVEFYNPSTGFDVWFEVSGTSGILGYVPPGTYYISFSSPCDNSNRTFYAACQYMSGSNGTAIFFDIPVTTTCHNIDIQ